MLINSLQPAWQSDLNRQYAALPDGAGLMLLIDSAFVPGICRDLGSACKPVLLFEFLPACSQEAKEVSPFVVLFDPKDKSLVRVMKRCSGWPMLSALATYESAEQLAQRLAAWCIVEVEGQDFNFRFPDTRRLPTILQTLTLTQRAEFTGNAVAWHYINREGAWCSLPLAPGLTQLSITEKTTLDGKQFEQLLADSEPDEVWTQLLDRGVGTNLLPSERHASLVDALHMADKNEVDNLLKIAWCQGFLEKAYEKKSEYWKPVGEAERKKFQE